MQFKTLLGAQSAIAVLLNMERPATDASGAVILGDSAPGNPASMNNNFLGGEDDFALAMGRDFILASFGSLISNIGTQATTLYSITISQVTADLTADLPTGKILLTIKGSATGHRWWTINFRFTVRLRFTLQANGDTVDLVPEDISEDDVDTDSWWVDHFGKGRIVAAVRDARDKALKQKDPNDPNSKDAYATVNDMLSADKNLGQFLKSLLKPPRPDPGAPPPQDVFILLWYNSVDITPSGVVLHGSLAVGDWPLAHVEFEQIPSTGGPGGVLGGVVPPSGPDYSALRSWIPGGTIQRYEWSMQGQAQPFLIDVNKFVLIHPPPEVSTGEASAGAVSGSIPTAVSSGVATTGAVSGFIPICLTVRGTRIASSGPAVAEPVSATHCGYTRVSILEGLEPSVGGELLMVALTQPGPGGLVEVAGHASARPDGTGGGTPNRIVHFADDKTAGHLEFLLWALRESKREDAATAVLAVLTADQLARARYTQDVIYAEEQGGAWARAFRVKTTRRPVTLIVAPKGGVVWQHEGELDKETLAAALRKLLVKTGPVRLGLLRLNLRIGRPAPNFLFEYAPGRGLTLRKLAGRPVVLVFWRSSSKPSIEAVRDLQKTSPKAGGQRPVVLAINDGEVGELAKRVAAENGFSAIVVPDPQREISAAYGVSIWPTTVFIDASGVVRNIRYGRYSGEQAEYSSRAKTTAAK